MIRDIEQQLSIYDGRDLVGMVIEHDGHCDAFNVNGVHLGKFRKRKAAFDAVALSRSNSPCVRDDSGRGGGDGA